MAQLTDGDGALRVMMFESTADGLNTSFAGRRHLTTESWAERAGPSRLPALAAQPPGLPGAAPLREVRASV